MAVIEGAKSRSKKGKIKLDNGEEVDYYEPIICGELIDMSYLQTYYWTITVLHQLNKLEADILTYMALHMDEENLIDFTKRHKESFLKGALDYEGKPRYSLRSIDNALVVLKKKLLIRSIYRGAFVVNPKYFFKDKTDKRLNLISLQLKFESQHKLTVTVDKQ